MRRRVRVGEHYEGCCGAHQVEIACHNDGIDAPPFQDSLDGAPDLLRLDLSANFLPVVGAVAALEIHCDGEHRSRSYLNDPARRGDSEIKVRLYATVPEGVGHQGLQPHHAAVRILHSVQLRNRFDQIPAYDGCALVTAGGSDHDVPDGVGLVSKPSKNRRDLRTAAPAWNFIEQEDVRIGQSEHGAVKVCVSKEILLAHVPR
jgi:hypothetical protein